MAIQMTKETEEYIAKLREELREVRKTELSNNARKRDLVSKITVLENKYRKCDWEIGQWVAEGTEEKHLYIGEITGIKPVRSDHGVFELSCSGYDINIFGFSDSEIREKNSIITTDGRLNAEGPRLVNNPRVKQDIEDIRVAIIDRNIIKATLDTKNAEIRSMISDLEGED